MRLKSSETSILNVLNFCQPLGAMAVEFQTDYVPFKSADVATMRSALEYRPGARVVWLIAPLEKGKKRQEKAGKNEKSIEPHGRLGFQAMWSKDPRRPPLQELPRNQ